MSLLTGTKSVLITNPEMELLRLLDLPGEGEEEEGGMKRPEFSKKFVRKVQLTKTTALANISTRVHSIALEEIKNDIEELGKDWKNLITDVKSDTFEALKQIVANLQWPPKLINKKKKTLVWLVDDSGFHFSLPPRNINNIYSTNYYLSEDLMDKVEFAPFSRDPKRRTKMTLYFPEPSPHQLRTITMIKSLGPIEFQKIKNKLNIYAPTFYECFIKANIAAQVASYKMSRKDVSEEEFERVILQNLSNRNLQKKVLRALSLDIRTYQNIGSRYIHKDKIRVPTIIEAEEEKTKRTKEKASKRAKRGSSKIRKIKEEEEEQPRLKREEEQKQKLLYQGR
jgi:hypothetical protein